jgi:transcriptional regulator with PAS, ATPase and Fis domain
VGKELVARALHELSLARLGPFVDLNCAAIPESLGEAELFGVERGAFTGALERRDGLLAAADHGTLFLDEVCSMSLGLQAKLLRALELQEFRRVGSRHVLRSTFRVIATVSEPAEHLMARGRLRPDLGFRLAGAEVTLPPLRGRRSDVLPLVEHFLAAGNGHGPWTLSAEATALLRAYAWPGNVRQLRMVVDRLRLLAPNPRIEEHHVCAAVGSATLGPARVRDALKRTRGSVRGAARLLGVPRTTLQRWITSSGAPDQLQTP